VVARKKTNVGHFAGALVLGATVLTSCTRDCAGGAPEATAGNAKETESKEALRKALAEALQKMGARDAGGAMRRGESRSGGAEKR
jgi:hypothetical protein